MAEVAIPLESNLSDRDRAILDFERHWWKYAGAKDQAIQELFGWGPQAYYEYLNHLMDRPEALEADPMLVKRLPIYEWVAPVALRLYLRFRMGFLRL